MASGSGATTGYKHAGFQRMYGKATETSRWSKGAAVRYGSETRPIRYTSAIMNTYHSLWFDGMKRPFEKEYQERRREDTWPWKTRGWEKGVDYQPVLTRRFSKEAIEKALEMVPDWFETSDVPRPPQRIKAVSDGIVGRWWSNYWTLHSMRYQCMLAGIPWTFGQRERPLTNYDEPFYFVDFEESKAVRDYRSRWINVHRSMVGMSKKMREAEDETREKNYKRLQNKFWSERKVLITRVKAMKTSRTLKSKDEMPLKGMNLRAFEA